MSVYILLVLDLCTWSTNRYNKNIIMIIKYYIGEGNTYVVLYGCIWCCSDKPSMKGFASVAYVMTRINDIW